MKLQKQKNQSVQCTIQDNLTNISENENLKPSVSTTKNTQKKNEDSFDSIPQNYIQRSKYIFLFINKNN